ncbi:M48 family metallopeptidase [Neobacillus sp. DY30]|uniref:M48 family metallopeptidase n=1 Tax=Neobacillus sp. DY30 TaxID=3047871 RepID=UPI0024C08D4E|nr:M48 family metallopeptidase [Neobacillus sp. DY30]WHY00210.1 M48 family metallopeptidase [Neobacillus sp. DY30]
MNEHVLTPKDLVHKNETKYFWFVLIISILSYIVLAISMVGILILLAIIVLSLFFYAFMIGRIRTNAVKLSPAQFPKVYQKAEELCTKMEIMKVPDIYVMQSDGMLNAFATRFFRRNMVVVYAEFFELIKTNVDDELYFVLAHELAHIKRNHPTKLSLILPAMWIPGVAELYLRACEYTCDRYAAYYTGNSEASKNCLTILAIGKTLYNHVNREEYLQQVNEEKGFVVWLSEVFSTHPPLPKRINEISKLFGETEQIYIKKDKSVRGWILVLVPLLSFGIITGGIYYAFTQLESMLDPIEEFEEGAIGEEITPLNAAVASGDTEKVSQLINQGEDVQQEDINGYTPLDWAVKAGNEKMAALLLKSGADPNYETTYGMTSLMWAAEIGDQMMVKMLIDAGGDPNYQDTSGMTALTHAVYSSDIETVQLLLDLGADPTIKDSQNMTPQMNAIQSDEREIAELLGKYMK